MTRSSSFVLIVAFGLAIACGDESDDTEPGSGTDVGSTDDAGTGDDVGADAAGPGSDADDDASVDTTLAEIHATIFAVSCGNGSCHIDGEASAGLNLDMDGDLRETLLGGSSGEVPYVTPGAPESSYMLMKLEGTFGDVGGAGDQMPRGRDPLPAETLELFEGWISAGALE